MSNKKIVNIREFQEKKAHVSFTQEEMNGLLGLFASRAREGEWMDYVVEQRNGIIAFSVFKGMYDAPAYTVAKCQKQPRSGLGRFLLLSGPQKLVQTDDMAEVLDYFYAQDALIADETTAKPELRIVR